MTPKHVVLACNAYLGGLNRQVAARVMPINSFMAATEPLGERRADVLPSDAAVADSKWVVNYFRMSEDNRLLFGGSEGYGYRFPKDIASQVRVPMEQAFPAAQGRENRLCVGRLAGDHDVALAVSCAAAAEYLVCFGLFGTWRRSDRNYGPIDRQSDPGRNRGL